LAVAQGNAQARKIFIAITTAAIAKIAAGPRQQGRD
jgi:hypothetical protein